MAKESAGILLYRFSNNQLQVLLVHPGGPFFQKKDLGSWSIPKGEFVETEEPLQAAIREFEEELGCKPAGPFLQLPTIRQKSGKMVHSWMAEGDLNADTIKCNTFTIEFPKGSGKMKSFPEIDKAQWFDLGTAKKKILESQQKLLEALEVVLKKI